MNRCLNDAFSYCDGKPKHKTTPVEVTYRDLGGLNTTATQLQTNCSLDPKTCGYYMTHRELTTKLTI